MLLDTLPALETALRACLKDSRELSQADEIRSILRNDIKEMEKQKQALCEQIRQHENALSAQNEACIDSDDLYWAVEDLSREWFQGKIIIDASIWDGDEVRIVTLSWFEEETGKAFQAQFQGNGSFPPYWQDDKVSELSDREALIRALAVIREKREKEGF